jgi:hypothetical protein
VPTTAALLSALTPREEGVRTIFTVHAFDGRTELPELPSLYNVARTEKSSRVAHKIRLTQMYTCVYYRQRTPLRTPVRSLKIRSSHLASLMDSGFVSSCLRDSVVKTVRRALASISGLENLYCRPALVAWKQPSTAAPTAAERRAVVLRTQTIPARKAYIFRPSRQNIVPSI